MESDLDVDDPSSHENELLAETWLLKITVSLNNDRDFSDVLDASKQQLECSLSTVSVISWAAWPTVTVLKILALNNMKALCTMVPQTKFVWES